MPNRHRHLSPPPAPPSPPAGRLDAHQAAETLGLDVQTFLADVQIGKLPPATWRGFYDDAGRWVNCPTWNRTALVQVGFGLKVHEAMPTSCPLPSLPHIDGKD